MKYQNSVAVVVKSEHNQPNLQYSTEEQFWTQHRTTLISYEAQFVHNFKPETCIQEHQNKRNKSKKKNVQYQGGFLFPGRPADKEQDIYSIILSSKFQNLRQLFSPQANISKEDLKLRQFVQILLELKHSLIRRQFLEIYQLMIRQIREVKFQAIRVQADRFAVIDQIATKVASFIQQCPFLFGQLSHYLRENSRETTKFFKVTAYCLLAERHNFSLNQFYCEAFDLQDLQDGEGRLPRKKKKTEFASDQDY